MRDAGDRAASMEVSSHAIHQSRIRGIEWDAAVFTNLTQDHLDYHHTMEAYFDTKASWFEHLPGQRKKRARAIVNLDDRYGGFLIGRLRKKVPVITYGFGVSADFRASNLRTSIGGTSFQLDARGRQYLVRSPLIGRFNVYNALAAIAAAAACNVEIRLAVAAFAGAPQVPGRMERISEKRSFHVFVDYAHTDDALANVLRALRELSPKRIITVFGCGGDRDRLKRPLMAQAAEAGSDYCVITSDNPRNEDPKRIIEDIRPGMRGRAFEVEPDRAAAIRRAIDLADAGDAVLIAGKGHENYQEIAGERHPFDDSLIARRAIHEKPSTEPEH